MNTSYYRDFKSVPHAIISLKRSIDSGRLQIPPDCFEKLLHYIRMELIIPQYSKCKGVHSYRFLYNWKYERNSPFLSEVSAFMAEYDEFLR